MVSKERISGFVDAVVAVIITVMLLEFHIPTSGSLHDFIDENLVYLIAYLLSFVYVALAWFNQQYLFKISEQVTRKVYVSIMLWLINMSLIPIATGWAGRTIDVSKNFGIDSPKAPALLYTIVLLSWSVAYVNMTRSFAKVHNKEVAKKILNMGIFKSLNSRYWRFPLLIVLTYFYPPTAFIYTFLEMSLSMYVSRNDKD